MAFLIVVAIIAFVLSMLVFRVSFFVVVHFDLDDKRLSVCVHFLGLDLIRIKICLSAPKLTVVVNGKIIERKKQSKTNFSQVAQAVNFAKSQKMFCVSNLIALVGLDDAAVTAQVVATCKILFGGRIFADMSSDRLSVEGHVRLRVCFVDAFHLKMLLN